MATRQCPHGVLLVAGFLLLPVSACKAGPSVFDREASDAPEPPTLVDTADLSVLPHVPDAPSVETLTAAPSGPGSDEGLSGVTGAVATGGSVRELRDSADSERGVTGMTDVGGEDVPPPGLGATADARFPEPEHVRGIYLNAWAAGSTRRVTALLELAARTEINTFVIDIKDASGFVSHPSRLPLVGEVGAAEEIRIRDLPGLLARLADAGIYPIARIVIVKDPILAESRPALAVQDTAGGVWVDSKGIIWLNLHDREVWDYHVALAREVAEMGFPEIQWDYVRFPDASRSDLARAAYPGAGDTSKRAGVRAFLEYARARLDSLGVRMTADVFGVTTSASRDVGIGQVWESFIDVVDVALPMVYPSHYWEGSFGIDAPNAYPYEIVKSALSDAVRRSAEVPGAGRTRPWLQDFSLGEPAYEAPEVRAQIQATYDAGVDEWILWNPSSRYTEAALEPVGGFVEPPMMRLGGEIVTVESRLDVLDTAAPDSLPGGAPVGDSLAAGDVGARTLAADTIGADTLATDTIGADTLAAETRDGHDRR